MKLDVAVNEVTLSNVGASGEFKIRNSAKAFKILSDGLYSNKKRAIIRELSCNAVDSHVAAGKADVPFEVHLPTMLEPWFAVRDFGTGLDDSQVMNIYTTYFESTKTNSNDFIGALGLGSKSPFSYTENFTVTAVKDGMKRIYSAYINDQGVPCVTAMSAEESSESNGVEVKFSVTDKYDYDSFRHEAVEVFKWFKVLPTITGAKVTLEPVRYTEKDIVPGVHTWGSHGCMAVMGNIAYPLNKIPEARKHFGDLADLLECGLIIEFDIGKLDFAASREELSYVPLTLRSIKEKLTEVNNNLVSHLKAKADAITCEWKRSVYLGAESRSRLYGAAVKKYVADTKFKLFDPNNYYGHFEFSFTLDELKQKDLEIVAASCHGTGSSKINHRSKYVNGNYVYSMNIPVSDDTIIVLNDLKTGCATRARYHYVNHHGSHVNIYCVSHSSPDMAVRQEAYDKFLKELHSPHTVVKASTLQKKERIKAETKQGIMQLEYRSGRSDYTWVPVGDGFENDDTVTYNYVALSNYSPQTLEGDHFALFELVSQLQNSGIKTLDRLPIYGVRKSVLKDIKPLTNWVWVEEKVKEEVMKVSDADIESAIALNMFDGYGETCYTNKDIAKLVGKDSKYSEFVAMHTNPKTSKVTPTGYYHAQNDLAGLVSLSAKYGKTVKVADIQKKVQKEKDALKARYPLLEHLKYAPDKLVADYIKLIDKTENTND